MKKSLQPTLILLLSLFMIGAVLTTVGCEETENSEKKLSVVTTVFPVYDWTKNVLGERLLSTELTMLLDSGVDLHSYQPSAADLVKISTCDVFIYVGGESDEWVEKALENVAGQKTVVVNLMELLGDKARPEEEVEGMQASEEEEEEGAYDEHIWLSLENASFLSQKIAEKLGEADRENQDVYLKNAQEYQRSIDEVSVRYQEEFKDIKDGYLLFADRFPFLYLLKDYGFSYSAAFSGCSAESEASFETVAFLAGKVNELGLKYIFILEGSDGEIARTVLQTAKSDAQILRLNSMQTTVLKDVENGADYLAIMKENLETIATSLR